MKEVESTILKFIWAGNLHNIKRATVINPISDCELKVTHIKTFMDSLKSTWVRRYNDELMGHKKFFTLI